MLIVGALGRQRLSMARVATKTWSVWGQGPRGRYPRGPLSGRLGWVWTRSFLPAFFVSGAIGCRSGVLDAGAHRLTTRRRRGRLVAGRSESIRSPGGALDQHLLLHHAAHDRGDRLVLRRVA